MARSSQSLDNVNVKCQSNEAKMQVKGAPTNNKQSNGRPSVKEREATTKKRKSTQKKWWVIT